MVIKKKIKKNINYYLSLPWTYLVEIGEDNGEKMYIIRVSEMPGVSTDAPTLDEAMDNIQEALTLAFEMAIEHGDEIPEPIDEDIDADKITYRPTKKRQALIAREAKKHNLSLSQMIDQLIDTHLQDKTVRTAR